MKTAQTLLAVLLWLVFPWNAWSAPPDSKLAGDYVFSFSGFRVGADGWSAFASAGRFTADGAGGLTNGELDANGASTSGARTAAKFTGTYAIGADRRGLMTFKLPQGDARLAFAMTASGDAELIKFDAAGGTGIVASGNMVKADRSAFNPAMVKGDYAFGLSGFTVAGSRVGMAGRFTVGGAGAISDGMADINEYKATRPVTISALNYQAFDNATGRGALSMSTWIAGDPRRLTFVFYVVDRNQLLLLRSDAMVGAAALLTGRALRQETPSEGFSDKSWKGRSVLYLTARTTCGHGSRLRDALAILSSAACGVEEAPVSVVLAGLFAADGHGGVALSFDQNCGGAHYSVRGLPGTYQVRRDGRISITAAPYRAVAYLVNPQLAFLLGTDSSGLVEAQADGVPTGRVPDGAYAGISATPASPDAVIFLGKFRANAMMSSGELIGAADIGAAVGPVANQPFRATYSISSSPVNGRGTMMVTSGAGGRAIVYVVSPSKFVAVPLNDPNPSVWVFQQ